MSITNPTQLVDEFKKSGEFDRLRRELLSQFQQSDGISAFKSRIESIARQRHTSDQKLKSLPQEAIHRELMQEVDRYPVVERAAADVHMLSDPSFAANIHNLVQGILRDGKGQKIQIRKEPDSEVKAEAPLKPMVTQPLESSDLTQQDLHPSLSMEATLALQSPNVVAINTPPPVAVLENSLVQALEGNLEREKVIPITVPSHPAPPTITHAVNNGESLIDVEMVDTTT